MAEPLVYCPPDAAAIRDARIEDILDRIMRGDANYWKSGSAHATLFLGEYGGNAPHFVLMLTAYGFYVEAAFVEDVRGKPQFVTYVPDARLGRTDVDEAWAGQSPMRIPRDFCLGRERCADAVRYFSETGGRDPRVPWVNSDSTGWDTNVDD